MMEVFSLHHKERHSLASAPTSADLQKKKEDSDILIAFSAISLYCIAFDL